MLITVSGDRLFRDRPLRGKTASAIGGPCSTVNSSHVFGGIITDGQTVCFSQRTNRCIGRAVVSENKSITALCIFRLKNLAVDHDLCRLDVEGDKTAGCKGGNCCRTDQQSRQCTGQKVCNSFHGSTSDSF